MQHIQITSKKIQKPIKKENIKDKNYDIFCYINKNKKQIALTKKNNLGFLNKFNLPQIKESGLQKKIQIKNGNFYANI